MNNTTTGNISNANSVIDFITSIAKSDVNSGYKQIKELEAITRQGNSVELQKWFLLKNYNISIDDCEK